MTAVLGLVAGGLGVTALAAAGAATAGAAVPNRCVEPASALRGMEAATFQALCLPDEKLAAMDDSGAVLAPGQTASSRNVKLLGNIPKPVPFDDATNSDLAFQGRYAFGGNYDGFIVYDIKNPLKPTVAASVLCPGAQNDISVFGSLLFLSTDSRRTDDSCASTAVAPAEGVNYWEGIKIFDISTPTSPRYIKSVETDCGSHTHTLAPSKDKKDVYVYVSSYSPAPTLADCQPPHDKISVIKVPTAAPTTAAIVNEPVLFPDGGWPGNGSPDGILSPGGVPTSGCHDITTYPERDIAAGACMGDGVLFDIKDRANPRVISTVRDTTNFAFWHSATFNNKGTKVVFTDELGGGGAPTCNPTVGQIRGANGIYDVTGRGDARQLEFKSYYKIPRTQSNTENCVAHNGSLIPVPGKDIMVQAWYQGGWSVFDFTDSSKPKEIAWFDRGPISDTTPTSGGNWSTYWYNGFVYSNEIARGFDVFAILDPRIAGALLTRETEVNVQTQERYPRWER